MWHLRYLNTDNVAEVITVSQTNPLWAAVPRFGGDSHQCVSEQQRLPESAYRGGVELDGERDL